VVAQVAEAIPVGVDLRRIEDVHAHVAGVPDQVPVGVALIEVGGGAAVVAQVPPPVAVRVVLRRVVEAGAGVDLVAGARESGVVQRAERTGIARVPHTVVVAVGLSRVGDAGTVVDRTDGGAHTPVAEPVPVGIGARVAGVADAVAVSVVLIGVRQARAVVFGI